MDTVRLGLIGAGWVADQHLGVIAMAPGVEAAGITSRTRSRAEELSAAHGGVPVFDTVEQLVEEGKPDALMVLTSEESTHGVVVEALAYGLPLFIEKPAGLTPAENADLADRARAAGVLTMVGFNRRYYSIMQQGIEIVREHGPLLGVMVEGHERFWKIEPAPKWNDTVKDEWIYVNSVHTIDLLRFFGGEASNISSIAHSFSRTTGDQFAAIMELESGAIGQYSAHWWSPGGWRVVLYGDGVTVEFKPLEEGRWIDRAFDVHGIEPAPYDRGRKPGFYGQILALAELVRTGVLHAPAQDLDGSLRTMRLAETIARRNAV